MWQLALMRDQVGGAALGSFQMLLELQKLEKFLEDCNSILSLSGYPRLVQ